MSDRSDEARPAPLTPRQQALIRAIQNLSPARRHTLTIICRGTEPWEIQEVVEHRKLDELKPQMT